jgi:C4-dicarboxylate-specific signal transduction histidine kinase
MGNSLDALTSGSTRQPEIKVDVLSQFKDEKNWIVLQIEDNGPGFNNEVLSQLNVPLQTTKPHGMGLGLLLTQSMVRMWDGHTLIGNRPSSQGSGACVQFWLSPVFPDKSI